MRRTLLPFGSKSKPLDPRAFRLAFVTDQFLPGDTTDTIQIVSMASAFGAVGVDLTLVLPAPPRRPFPTAPALASRYGLEPTFEVLPLKGPYPAPFNLRGVDKVTHALRTTARVALTGIFDAVYTRNLPVVLGALAGTRLPIFYETYRPWPDLSRMKRTLFEGLRSRERLAGLVLHSQIAADSYRRLGYAEDRLLVAHNGLDPRHFEAPIDQDEARRRLGLPPKGPLAVYAGHLTPDKGLELVLDAAARLPELRFALVGSIGEGPIEQRARLLPNVRVAPWAPPAEVSAWLAAADILLIPPTAHAPEPLGPMLPMKTFEYLASGRAIVAPDTAHVREVLEDGYDARLVPPGELEPFVSALRRLAADPALRAALGNRGRGSALERTWEERARRIVTFMGRRGVAGAAKVADSFGRRPRA